MSAKNGFGRSIELAKLARLHLAEARLLLNKREQARGIAQLLNAVECLLTSHNNVVWSKMKKRKDITKRKK